MGTENRKLDFKRLVATIELLEKRISDRFPDSGIQKVCHNLLGIAEETKKKIEWISKPNYWVRIPVLLIIILGIAGIIFSFSSLELKSQKFTITDVITGSEAALNDLVYVGIAIFFLITVEKRIKRTRSLKMINELRNMAHIVDMHQLTKDPIVINAKNRSTTHSPKREFDRFELERYLNYCAEQLSLIGKVAALYSQSLPDDVVIHAVNEIETLTDGISRKIWQKVSILHDYESDRISAELTRKGVESTEKSDET